MNLLRCALLSLVSVDSSVIRPVRGIRRMGGPLPLALDYVTQGKRSLLDLAFDASLVDQLNRPPPASLGSGIHRYQSFGECMADTVVQETGDFWYGAFLGEVRFLVHADLPWASTSILIIGGNIGHDASQFLHRYMPKSMLIFEPVPYLARELEAKFQAYPQVRILEFGLDADAGNTTVFLQGETDEAASAYFRLDTVDSAHAVTCQVRKLSDLLLQSDPDEKVMISMNCEGCEYGVIEDLLAVIDPRTGLPLISRIHTLQFSRHLITSSMGSSPGIPHLVPRYCRIHEALQRTHKMQYLYPWWWESWVVDM